MRQKWKSWMNYDTPKHFHQQAIDALDREGYEAIQKRGSDVDFGDIRRHVKESFRLGPAADEPTRIPRAAGPS